MTISTNILINNNTVWCHSLKTQRLVRNSGSVPNRWITAPVPVGSMLEPSLHECDIIMASVSCHWAVVCDVTSSVWGILGQNGQVLVLQSDIWVFLGVLNLFLAHSLVCECEPSWRHGEWVWNVCCPLVVEGVPAVTPDDVKLTWSRC